MLTLYHAPRTRSVRVLWLLEELGLPYRLESLAFKAEVLRGAEHLRRHPLGKLPVIEDDGMTMFESGAIIEYVLETYGRGRLAPLPGSLARGLFLQWVHFAEATALPPLGDLVRHTILLPEAERVPAVVSDARRRAAAVLAVIEAAVRGNPYLVGDQFTAADVMMGYGLLLSKWFGLIDDQFPATAAYLARLESRPALQKALAL